MQAAFDQDSHLNLIHPRMYAVPDYEQREIDKGKMRQTATDLKAQINDKSVSKALQQVQERELYNQQVTQRMEEMDRA